MINNADGFEHYGTTQSIPLAGAWASMAASPRVIVSNTQARTGTYSLKFDHDGAEVDATEAVWPTQSADLTQGLAFGFYCDDLPADLRHGIALRRADLTLIAAVAVMADGKVAVLDGDLALIEETAAAVITADAWHHIEAKFIIDDTNGSVIVKVDGNDALDVSGEDFDIVAANAWIVGNLDPGGADVVYYVDDIVTWDGIGAANSDFLGVVRVSTIYPTADLPAAAWAKTGSASGFDCINDIVPDDDTTYVGSDTQGQVSEFELGATPSEVEIVSAVVLVGRGRLEAAGAGNVQMSILSNGDVANGQDKALSNTYRYWNDAFQVDPDTGLAWTKTAVDNAQVRIKKTV